MAITLDGKIAKHKAHFPNWTSKEDKKFFAKISKEHKVVLMGANTFSTFKKPLKDRLNVVLAKIIIILRQKMFFGLEEK